MDIFLISGMVFCQILIQRMLKVLVNYVKEESKKFHKRNKKKNV